LLIGVRSSFQHLIEAAGCALEFLQFLLILASCDSLALSFGKRWALGAIVAGEDREWHFLMMFPRSITVTVLYN